MYVWYQKKDNLILFKMIPYLLWLFHQGKGNISKYEIWSQLKSCKMNTMQWSRRVHKEHVLCGVELVMSFVISWSVHDIHQQHEDAVPGGSAGTWVVHPIPSPGHVIKINEHWLNQISLWQYALKFNNWGKSSPCHFMFMFLVWLMWWRLCEITWFESSF